MVCYFIFVIGILNFLYLLFFCSRQWLGPKKLKKLGVSMVIDEEKLTESRKPTERKAVKKAYNEALHYRKQTHNAMSTS